MERNRYHSSKVGGVRWNFSFVVWWRVCFLTFDALPFQQKIGRVGYISITTRRRKRPKFSETYHWKKWLLQSKFRSGSPGDGKFRKKIDPQNSSFRSSSSTWEVSVLIYRFVFPWFCNSEYPQIDVHRHSMSCWRCLGSSKWNVSTSSLTPHHNSPDGQCDYPYCTSNFPPSHLIFSPEYFKLPLLNLNSLRSFRLVSFAWKAFKDSRLATWEICFLSLKKGFQTERLHTPNPLQSGLDDKIHTISAKMGIFHSRPSVPTTTTTSIALPTATSTPGGLTISPDNTCGLTGVGGSPANYTCPTSLPCCSINGFCGSTTDYCLTGCQSAFGTCNVIIPGAPTPAEDPEKCGPGVGSCAASKCCSIEGFCGTTKGMCFHASSWKIEGKPRLWDYGVNEGLYEDHCQAPDCQMNFGPKCDANASPAGTNTSAIGRPKVGSILYGSSGIFDCQNNGDMALTFDDGPYIYTSGILDLMKTYDAKATFFVTGNNNGMSKHFTSIPLCLPRKRPKQTYLSRH